MNIDLSKLPLDVYTTREIAEIHKLRTTKPFLQSLGHKLKAIGAVRVPGCVIVKESRIRVWAIRNHERYPTIMDAREYRGWYK